MYTHLSKRRYGACRLFASLSRGFFQCQWILWTNTQWLPILKCVSMSERIKSPAGNASYFFFLFKRIREKIGESLLWLLLLYPLSIYILYGFGSQHHAKWCITHTLLCLDSHAVCSIVDYTSWSTLHLVHDKCNQMKKMRAGMNKQSIDLFCCFFFFCPLFSFGVTFCSLAFSVLFKNW